MMGDVRIELQSYTKKIWDGFARYQQNGDFVDMTLAVKGHLVKVHKNMMSLSSPFIEEILKSIPCKHPVIFLNNVTPEVLGYILEYIYTGVACIPRNAYDEFLIACKQLHIIGIKDCQNTMMGARPKSDKTVEIHETAPKVKAPAVTSPMIIDTQSSKEKHIEDRNIFHSNLKTIDEYPINDTSDDDDDRSDIEMTNCDNNVRQESQSDSHMNTKATKRSYKDMNVMVPATSFNDTLQKDQSYNDINVAPGTVFDNDLLQEGQSHNKINVAPATNFDNNVLQKDQTYKDFNIHPATSFDNDFLQENQSYNLKVIGPATSFDNNVVQECESDTAYSNNTDNVKYRIDLSNIILECSNRGSTMPVFDTNSTNDAVKLLVNPTPNEHSFTNEGKMLPGLTEESTHFTNGIQESVTDNYMVENVPKIKIHSIQKVSFKPMPVQDSIENMSISTLPTQYIPEKNENMQNNIVFGIEQMQNGSTACESLNENYELPENSENSKLPPGCSPLYMLSSRGGLQMVLNRYMYNTHHYNKTGSHRRWRCIHYRTKKCKAYLDTVNDEIVKRVFAHNHGFHDKEILRHGRLSQVFTTMLDAWNHGLSKK